MCTRKLHYTGLFVIFYLLSPLFCVCLSFSFPKSFFLFFTFLFVQVLQSVTQLSSHLQENELSSMGDSQRDSVSCHLLLITLLMEASIKSVQAGASYFLNNFSKLSSVADILN